MKTISDIKKYIQAEYGVSPESEKAGILKYRAITFEKAAASIILANKETADMWTVQRTGHSIDFFRTDELKQAINPGGSLLYFFMPLDRI
tara:strand:+ start:378 stop:647 length:270 start_codon:yes stop_codon:yes gene_type:complete